MRIAMLAWESLHSFAVGGVAAHVSELAVALERHGHDVCVFTRRESGQSFYSSIDGVDYYRCAYNVQQNFVEDVNQMCRAFVDHFFEVEDRFGAFDVVHAHDWLTVNAMVWIKQGRGRCCVLTVHSTEYGRCGNRFYGGQCERIREVERGGMAWADRVITVSNSLNREIQWMYEVPEDKVYVIANGVNTRRFDIEMKPEVSDRGQPMVLFCGRLTMQKGPDLMVDAIPRVLDLHPNARFMVAGDGDMRQSLEGRERDLGVQNATQFLGHRSGQELVRLFHESDVVCVPSRNEPFGIVVLEAWSARKPVVVTDTGGPGEYVRHEMNGLKIFPTSDSVAWGLRSVLDSPDRASWMGENGRKLVETQYGWDDIASKTEAIYDPDSVGQFGAETDESAEGEIGEKIFEQITAAVHSGKADRGLQSCEFRSSKPNYRSRFIGRSSISSV